MSPTESIREIIRSRSQPLSPQPTGAVPRLQVLGGLRAVIFDIYGTLLISGVGDVGTVSTSDRSEAFREVLRDHVDDHNSVDFTIFTEVVAAHHERDRAAGIPHPEVDILAVWRDVLRELGIDDPLEVDDLQRLAVDFETRTNSVWPMPNAEACLTGIVERGLPLGLVSNAQFFTPELFPCLFGRSVVEMGFDERLLFYSYEFGHAKPGRLLFEKLSAALAVNGIPPSEAIYVGNDMLNDIYAAQRAGFRTALFAGDARSLRLREADPRIAGVTPDLVLTDLAQLTACVATNESL